MGEGERGRKRAREDKRNIVVYIIVKHSVRLEHYYGITVCVRIHTHVSMRLYHINVPASVSVSMCAV